VSSCSTIESSSPIRRPARPRQSRSWCARDCRGASCCPPANADAIGDRGWRRGVSHIDLVSPRVRSLEGMMLAWSPGTKGRPVTAPVIVLPKFADSTEFVKWLPKARGKIVMLSPAWPTCRPSEDWYRWSTPESMARMDTLIAEMQRDWAASPDSTKLYRGTGYGLALGTGTLGMRLEKAGIVGMISSRTKLSGFANPFAQRYYDRSRVNGSLSMQPGDEIRLRYRVIIHPADFDVAKAYADYSNQ